MKKSELKAQIELKNKESRKRYEENEARMKKQHEKPETYTNMVCPSIRFGLGGTNPNGTSGSCWHCKECGRSGINTYNLRKQDTLIENKCDLED